MRGSYRNSNRRRLPFKRTSWAWDYNYFHMKFISKQLQTMIWKQYPTNNMDSRVNSLSPTTSIYTNQLVWQGKFFCSFVSRGGVVVFTLNKSHFVILIICAKEQWSLQTQCSLMCYWLIAITMAWILWGQNTSQVEEHETQGVIGVSKVQWLCLCK